MIEERLVAEGGWIERQGARTFNLYLPPVVALGDPAQSEPWLAHVRRLYPDDAEHILRWCAHRVQRPGEKINHALVLLVGGPLLGNVPSIIQKLSQRKTPRSG